MGLDSVEFVMEVEEIFDLSFPEEDAVKVTTPGQVADFVQRQLALEPKTNPGTNQPWTRDEILEGVLGSLERILGHRNFDENSRFIEDIQLD